MYPFIPRLLSCLCLGVLLYAPIGSVQTFDSCLAYLGITRGTAGQDQETGATVTLVVHGMTKSRSGAT